MSTDKRLPKAPADSVSPRSRPQSRQLAAPGGRGSRRGPRQPARTFAILLLLVGLGGYVVAAAADSSVGKTSVADETALGQQDPVAGAQTLRSRVTPIKVAYDSYAAASLAVVTARADVIKLFSTVRAQSTPGSVEATTARGQLSTGIAAYGAAVERENEKRQAYARQLALLMAEVHR
jgi:hypothetical protein